MNVISEQKMEQSVATNGRRTFTKVLGADKGKVHRDQTPEETTTKMQCLTGEVAVRVKTNVIVRDAMFDWRSGCQSEDKCNCHIHMTSIMITTCFCTNREHYRLLFSYFCH